MLAFVLAVALAPGRAHAVLYPCTLAGFDTALTAGGIATFSCAGPTTIVVPGTRTISRPGTDIDGEGRLVISGNDARVPLVVAAGVTATIRRLTIERGNSPAYGGCIDVVGTLDLERSTVRTCRAATGGNGIYVRAGGRLRASASTFSGNDGGVEGAIGVHGGIADLTNVTIEGPLRGVVTRYGGSATLTHCTITTTHEPAFAIAAGDTVTIGHSLLVSSGSPAVTGAGTFVSTGYNVFRVAPSMTPTGDVTGNQVATPLLGPLADNGGPTQTRALLACSPGIDAGAISGGPANDQRGQPRRAGGARDVGAYESDLRPCLTISDVTTTEGDAGTVNATLTVSLSGLSSVAASVSYATANGTALVDDNDYVAASGTLTFPAGTTTRTVAIAVRGDVRFEPNETIMVNLSAATGATLADAQGVVTIDNDDVRPSMSVANATIAEGDAGNSTLAFVITLTAPTSETVTVGFATSDGTATAGVDYAARTGTVTFTPGATSRTVNVTVVGDVVHEPNESLELELSGPTGATITDGNGLGTITNDDAAPAISVSDVSVDEGDSGTTPARFTVSLSRPSASQVRVSYATQVGSATLADADYVQAMGTLTFAPEVTSLDVVVDVRGDLRHEPDEAFALLLSAPSGGTLADSVGVGTIVNDDAAPTITVSDATVVEGTTGVATATFLVTLSNPSSSPIDVAYATADDTATLADSDYTAATGTLRLGAGETSRAIGVSVRGDTRYEPDETFVLRLSAPSIGTLGDAEGVGTIENDDGLPTLAIDDVAVTETDGALDASVTVRLAGVSAGTVTVGYATADDTATSGADYDAASGTLTFAPGVTTQTIALRVLGDDVHEGVERFAVALSSPSGATLADGSAVVTITDDETEPVLAIADATSAEGNAGTTPATLAVTLSGPSAASITVAWATADGTATTADYVASSGTLTFAPGELAQTVAIDVTGDTISEPDETVLVRLSGATNATIADAEAALTITDDEGAPIVVVAGAEVDEGDEGTTDLAFAITLSHASSDTVTIDYATEDGTATVDDGDYESATGTLTFAPGETTQTVTVHVLGDLEVESDETLLLVLSAATNATLDEESVEGTITNDDEAPDAGTDAGEPLDASVAVDAGTAPDAGVVVRSDGGCGCVVIGGDRRAVSPIAAAVMLALALVLAARRRAR
ncbi:Calx-beta domain-containing protein [Sandaracinus amylolyticus]|uniref:Calx-beta domain-containing protein n=1 Tax=Sandaracinus amylolyticus TaxID=927083 RepID=UPI001F3A2987|nr:Calx-beta domain-containing protein [Sandaracinus amylolyticus]